MQCMTDACMIAYMCVSRHVFMYSCMCGGEGVSHGH